jgi:type I restriction enzyme, S subunit
MAFTMTVAEVIAKDTSGLLSKHASWERIPLADVASILNGAPFDSSLFSSSDGVPLIRIRDVVTGKTSTYYMGVYEDIHVVEKGDLLVGMDGDFNSAFWQSQRALLNQRVCKITSNNDYFDRNFLSYLLPGYLAAINANTPSLTVKHLSSKTICEIELPLPPRAEQTRIVQKIEELFSSSDVGLNELCIALKKLGHYRQSLLKSAVDGELTAEWREKQLQNTAPQVTGEKLLKGILLERRAYWEAKQIAKFDEQGKTPSKDWQKKYPHPVEPDTSHLPKLPIGWVWATLSQVGWLDRGKSKHRPRNAPHLYGGAYPFVQTGDIRHADTFISNVDATYSEAGLAQSLLWPVGTMCITVAANIGKTAILSMEACFPDSIVGFLSYTDEVLVRYVEYFMRTIQQKLEDEAPATAQKNINLEILKKIAIPLPPTNEQIHIVESLDKLLAAISSQILAIELGIKQSDTQRKNILKDAFTGQLVPQNYNDEPASVLLARIRAERAERDKQSKLRIIKKHKEIAAVVKKLKEVLAEAGDWITAKEAFRLCGVVDGAQTEQVEALYGELRILDQAGSLAVEPVKDAQGRKLYDRLKLKVG